MEGIEVVEVSRSFGNVHAVRNAHFVAQPGRVTGLIGPNGAGKTTLLLMLASLLAPDRGSIRIAGLDPAVDAPGARAATGWMPDALGTWGALTARESIVTTGRLYDMPVAVAKERAAELLEMVGLTDLADAPARVLSRGQKQKLGLARALVHDPGVLLLDEPASGLDPQARVDLRELLRRFAAEGKTVLISSHILSELEEVIDDAVFMVQGVVVEALPVQEAARGWRIRLTDALPDPAQIAAILAIDPAQVLADRGGVTVPFRTESDAVLGLRTLIGAGVSVVEFAPARSHLEHTLLNLQAGNASGEHA